MCLNFFNQLGNQRRLHSPLAITLSHKCFHPGTNMHRGNSLRCQLASEGMLNPSHWVKKSGRMSGIMAKE